MIRIIYRIEASPALRLVNMDVTNEDHVRHALDYVAENLPAGQQGKNQNTTQALLSSLLSSSLLLATTNKLM